MTEFDSLAFVRSVFDTFNTREHEKAASMCTSDAETVDMPSGKSRTGPEGFVEGNMSWIRAFSDASLEVTRVFAHGNDAVVEFIGRGTHDGPLQTPAGTIPPTGRKVELKLCDVYLFRDGKVASCRQYYDVATVFRQLGIGAAGSTGEAGETTAKAA